MASALAVPVYSSDFELLDLISTKRALQLEAQGVAKVVRRKGYVNRVILHRRSGDPRPLEAGDHRGTAYSFKQRLGDGRHCWKLRPLQGGSSESTIAPAELRPDFHRVLLDCMVSE